MIKLNKKSGAPITGAVLAGGLSSRLGQDKAALEISGGVDLLTRSVLLLREVLPRVLVVGRASPALESMPGVECVPDAWPQNGPVGGIATALRHSGTDCLALSCDLPFMAAPVLEKLIAAWGGKHPATLLYAYSQKDTGKTENLVSIYSLNALPLFENALDKKLLKVSLVIPPEKTETLEYGFTDSLPFFNINYPADLLLAKKYLAIEK